MNLAKKNLKRIIPTLVLAVGVLAAFWIFIQDNASRIRRQNEEYIYELTQQRAVSIDSLVTENLNFINSTAYLYGRNLTSPWADVAVIREYEENTVFDLLRFIDSSGDDYTSKGVMANLADRDYFLAGMSGETGITYVLHSRVTGERQIGFYAPVYYDGSIIGVMVGFYGEEYIQKLLEYELFGYEGEGWLCTRDGTVLGSTLTETPDNYITYMKDEEKCSEEELGHLEEIFASGGEGSFTYVSGEEEAIGYAVSLEAEDWVLIRNFPPSASKQILENANQEGERFIATLVILFLLYIVYMAVDVFRTQRKMREANRDANDVSTGVSRLFSKFIAVNLETGEYKYVGGRPSEASLLPSGDYEKLSETILRRVPDGSQWREAAWLLKIENIKAQLRYKNRVSFRIQAPSEGGEWFTFNFIVLERDGSEAKRILLASQDVTALHRKEEEEQRKLQEALDTAEHASRAKTEFLFNMSHDIRTPMNAIIGYTELAQREGVPEEEMRAYIKKIDSSSLHLLALINDILEMSRIESGKMILEPVPTDLVRTMDEAKEMFATQMEGKHISFTVEASGIANRWVSCDKNRLNRILLNLLSNAFKFTEEGGEISAVLKQTDSSEETAAYELRVKDNGIGMSPEFAAKLFTPFERERTSTVSGIQGTGLGLSITKSIVELMGGSIEVVTKQGEGTEFIVTLRFPITEGETKDDETEKQKPENVDFSQTRLLLVEDNAINREIAKLILSQAGFLLEIAENGKEAVDMVAASSPDYYDAILMDVQMPVMDGYTATREIRSLSDPQLAAVPIIAMTANAFREDIQAAKDAGMNSHIAKPLDVEKMMATLTEVLTQSRG